MAKYSTGGAGSGGSGDACELCGREAGNLQQANVAGADLLVCSDCAPHGESADDGPSEETDERDRRAAENTANVFDGARGDSTHWEEEGTDYEADPLPYLVDDYGAALERGRQGAGLTVEELAQQTGLDADDVLAVEQGRAARANVGGSVVRELESFLEVDLIEE